MQSGQDRERDGERPHELSFDRGHRSGPWAAWGAYEQAPRDEHRLRFEREWRQWPGTAARAESLDQARGSSLTATPILMPRVAELRGRYSPYHPPPRGPLVFPRRSASLTNSPVQTDRPLYPTLLGHDEEEREPARALGRQLKRHDSWPNTMRFPPRQQWASTDLVADHHQFFDGSHQDSRLRTSSADFFTDRRPSFDAMLSVHEDNNDDAADDSDGYASPSPWIAQVGKISMNDSSPAESPRIHTPAKASTGIAKSASSGKTSRYLREMDRRIILSRLAKGEKQAALAKEYHVSRSTICNLLKQRDIVLARKDENPLSRHPKKTRYQGGGLRGEDRSTSSSSGGTNQAAGASTLASRQQDEELEEKPASAFFSFRPDVVIEVDSRAISLLKTRIHSRETPADEFSRSSSRLMRLLIEESLAILASTSPMDAPSRAPRKLTRRGYCAISLETSQRAMLDAFRAIEPDQLTGAIRLGRTDMPDLVLHVENHPRDLSGYDVLLVDLVVASGDSACAAIDLLRVRGVVSERIALVALFVAAEVVALVQYAHPHVRILTATIDHQLHTRGRTSDAAFTSPSRAFLERFHTLLN